MEAIIKHRENLVRIVSELDLEAVGQITMLFRDAILTGKKIFLIGNGGSAANAIHFASDLNNTFSQNSANGFHALSLTENISTILAIGNDFDFDEIFVRQLSCHLRDGDLLVCLSSSGNSANVLKACELVKDRYTGTKIISFTGYNGGALAPLSDVNLNVLIDDTQIAEDVQLFTFHAIYKQLCGELIPSSACNRLSYDLK